MSIEWVPRAGREGNGWRDPLTSEVAGVPWLTEVGGQRGVVVPVVPGVAASGQARGEVFRVLVGGGVAVSALPGQVWVPGLLGAGWALVSARRLVRGVVARRRDPSLAVTASGVHTGGLVLPWSVVEAVVRFSQDGPGGGRGVRSRPWNHLALRVDDFDNVVGLSPARAGLANLTRRHLVLVCETGELRDPGTVARALEFLIERPEARLLLSGAEGLRLFTEGPPRG